MTPFRRPNPAAGQLCTSPAPAGASAIAYAPNSAPSPPPQPNAAQAGTLPPPATHHTHTQAPAPPSQTEVPAPPPTHVRIPSIGIDAATDTPGLNPDGTEQIPNQPDEPGRYHGSTTPGQTGTAVLLGHLDSTTTGPAAFYRLGQPTPGAPILATRKNATTAALTVDAAREFPKSAFPTNQARGPHQTPPAKEKR